MGVVRKVGAEEKGGIDREYFWSNSELLEWKMTETWTQWENWKRKLKTSVVSNLEKSQSKDKAEGRPAKYWNSTVKKDSKPLVNGNYI